jgi:uncharacterized membrane protein
MAGEVNFSMPYAIQTGASQATAGASDDWLTQIGNVWNNMWAQGGAAVGQGFGTAASNIGAGVGQGVSNIGAGAGQALGQAISGIGAGGRVAVGQIGLGVGEGVQGAFGKIFPVIIVGVVIYVIIMVVKQA